MSPGDAHRDIDELAPIVAGTISWTPSTDAAPAVSIDAGDRVIDVEGELVTTVLSECDGRNTIAGIAGRHGDDARELLAALLESGAVVDAVDAWRIFHRQGSAGTAIGRGASDDEIAALQRRSFEPDGITDEGVALADAEGALAALVATRQSTSPDTPVALPDFEQLSTLLASVYRVRPRDERGVAKTGANASAGALFPLVVHTFLRHDAGPLDPGLWWHDPIALREHSVSAGGDDVRQVFLREPNCDLLLERGGPIVFLSADLTGPSRKYGSRGYRYTLIEIGAAMHNASLAAAELGLPLRVIGGIDDSLAKQFLGLPDSTVCLLALIVG